MSKIKQIKPFISESTVKLYLTKFEKLTVDERKIITSILDLLAHPIFIQNYIEE